MEYYVYITNKCNLNCEYCSVLLDINKLGIPIAPTYNFEKLKDFIDNTQKQFHDNIADIYFFGGEPTIDYKTIDKLIHLFDTEDSYKINFIMHTNGLLIPAAPRSIIRNLKIALISINYEKIYDNNGMMTDYFYKIVNAVEYMRQEKQFPIIGRLTITTKTNLYDECCLMGDFFDYIYWQLDNSNLLNNYDTFAVNYKRQIDVLFKNWISLLEKGIFIKYIPFISVINNYLNRESIPQNYFCGYGNSQIYIQTDGNCYACCDNVETSAHYIGDIFNGIKFTNSIIDNPTCNSCQYIKVCGGRCGRMHRDFDDKRISQFCELNQYMFETVIQSMPKIKNLISEYPHYMEIINDANLSYTEYTP